VQALSRVLAGICCRLCAATTNARKAQSVTLPSCRLRRSSVTGPLLSSWRMGCGAFLTADALIKQMSGPLHKIKDRVLFS
jgi:hypothetical protein